MTEKGAVLSEYKSGAVLDSGTGEIAGIPNSCQNGGCHLDKSVEWAIKEFELFYQQLSSFCILRDASLFLLERKRDPLPFR